MGDSDLTLKKFVGGYLQRAPFCQQLQSKWPILVLVCWKHCRRFIVLFRIMESNDLTVFQAIVVKNQILVDLQSVQD